MYYSVSLWSGAGYWLNSPVLVEARDEEEALVLASIKDGNCLFIEATDERADDLEDADNYVYLDRSEYGHSVGYLCIENAVIRTLSWCEYTIESLKRKPRNEWTDEDSEAYDYAKGTLESEEAEKRYLNGEE